MQEATVCHLLRGSGEDAEILFGRRARSLFANGIWGGPGGKFEEGETISQCARREVREEFGVVIHVPTVRHFATADFYHPNASGHSLKWRVHFLDVTRWRGEPSPREGFDKLRWFPRRNLPYSLMMADQAAWLPLALHDTTGRLLTVEIFYADEGLRTIAKGYFKFVDSPVKPARKRRN